VIKGRVIRIIDKKRVILNIGEVDGVGRGMSFGIFTPIETIQDPETGAELGSYRRRKATVEIDEVHRQFSVASPPTRYRAAGFVNPLQGETIWPDLPVQDQDIDPLVSGSTVQVGDVAETEDEGSSREDTGIESGAGPDESE
jgi:hypothetical protein